MNKKIISCLLVASLSFSIGCYSTETVTKEELKAAGKQLDITVYTNDSLKYEFAKEDYRIQGDSLSGLGWRRIDRFEYKRSDVSISLADITSIETERFRVVETILVVVLPVGLFGLFIAIVISGIR